MMKNFFIILLTILFFGKGNSQETLYSILDSLSVNEKIVNVKKLKKGTKYFKYLQNGSDFWLAKNDRICCNMKIFKISTYRNYNLYCILHDDTDDPVNDTFGSVILFDKNLNRCFIIEYGFIKNIIIQDKRTYLLNNNFASRVSKIIEVDNNLLPMSSLNIDFDINYQLFSFVNYYQENKKWYRKSLIFNEKIEYKNLKYNDFISLFNMKSGEAEKIECSIDDNYSLYKFVWRWK